MPGPFRHRPDVSSIGPMPGRFWHIAAYLQGCPVCVYVMWSCSDAMFCSFVQLHLTCGAPQALTSDALLTSGAISTSGALSTSGAPHALTYGVVLAPICQTLLPCRTSSPSSIWGTSVVTIFSRLCQHRWLHCCSGLSGARCLVIT